MNKKTSHFSKAGDCLHLIFIRHHLNPPSQFRNVKKDIFMMIKLKRQKQRYLDQAKLIYSLRKSAQDLSAKIDEFQKLNQQIKESNVNQAFEGAR